MKPVKTSELFVDFGQGGSIFGSESCLIIEKAMMKKITCRRAGYYVDCRNCNIPTLYPEIAKRIIAEKTV